MWKIFHSRWTVLLQVEWSVLQRTLSGSYFTPCGQEYCSFEWSVLYWTLSGRYFTACGQWYCSLKGVCYSEHYLEDISQHVDSGIAASVECVTMNIIWKLFHSMWTVLLQFEWSVLHWTLSLRYFTACGQEYCSFKGVYYSEHYLEVISQHVDSVILAWMECVTVNIMLKILHSKWTVVL